jgi:hypothetical protein
MNPLAHEWFAKAEGDYASALRELRARKRPNYDVAIGVSILMADITLP